MTDHANGTKPTIDAMKIIRERGQHGAMLAEMIETLAQNLEKNPDYRLRGAILAAQLKIGPQSHDLAVDISTMGSGASQSVLTQEIQTVHLMNRLDARREQESREMQTTLRSAIQHGRARVMSMEDILADEDIPDFIKKSLLQGMPAPDGPAAGPAPGETTDGQ